VLDKCGSIHRMVWHSVSLANWVIRATLIQYQGSSFFDLRHQGLIISSGMVIIKALGSKVIAFQKRSIEKQRRRSQAKQKNSDGSWIMPADALV
jgi:hypothetical protein